MESDKVESGNTSQLKLFANVLSSKAKGKHVLDFSVRVLLLVFKGNELHAGDSCMEIKMKAAASSCFPMLRGGDLTFA